MVGLWILHQQVHILMLASLASFNFPYDKSHLLYKVQKPIISDFNSILCHFNTTQEIRFLRGIGELQGGLHVTVSLIFLLV
jgi:hypothetical protein